MDDDVDWKYIIPSPGSSHNILSGIECSVSAVTLFTVFLYLIKHEFVLLKLPCALRICASGKKI